jgi:ribonuclease T2
MRSLIILNFAAFFAFATAFASEEFDHYFLSLNWSPSLGSLKGGAKSYPQCAQEADFGWILHGLWHQNAKNWPSYCNRVSSKPSRDMTAAMVDITRSSSLAQYQWKKHGTCSGLTAD